MSLENKIEKLEIKRHKIEADIKVLKDKRVAEIARTLAHLDLKDLDASLEQDSSLALSLRTLGQTWFSKRG